MSVSNEFKNITKKIKQQNIKLNIYDGKITVQEIHMMPVHIFNALPIWKLRKQKEVIAKELKYSFDGQLFKTIMKQVEITVKNANEIKDKDVNFQYGLFINNKFEYVDLGNYFIKDIEDSKKKDEIIVTGYDRMIRFMKTFKQSDLQLTYPCKMLELVQKICEVCKVDLYSTDFYNADLDVTEDFFSVQELTYRDVLEKVTQATLTTAFIEDNKLNLYKVNNNELETLDKSYLTDLTIKEQFGPINALVLGRGNVEDNIEEIDEKSIEENGRCEIRFDENEFIEFQREKLIKGMFEQIKGLKYYSFEASDVGVMWLKPCASIKLGDKENSLYNSYYLKANITINTGISSNIEAELPEQTNTEYKVTTKEEKKSLKVERLAKKNEGLIRDLVEETSEQSKKLTKVEQTFDTISQTVSDIENLTNEVEGIKTITLENCAEGELYELHIYGNNTVFEYLAPADTLYPNNNLYPIGDSKIVVTDKDGNKKVYELGVTDVLKQKGNVRDEYILWDSKAKIIRRINDDGTIKDTATEEELGEISIQLSEGKNTISILAYSAELYAKWIIKNNLTDAFVPNISLGTKIRQNSTSVQIAWNQISEFIQFMTLNNNAVLAILDENQNILMTLEKNGQYFYDTDLGEVFGEMGVHYEKELNSQNENRYISFGVQGEYNKEISNGMAWGITTISDKKFHPVLYIKNFKMSEETSDASHGELVLSSCDVVLDGIGTGIKSGEIKLIGDPQGGAFYFYDTVKDEYLMSIEKSTYTAGDIINILNKLIITEDSINILDKIKFFANQSGSNSFKIGDNSYCLLTDEGDMSCSNSLYVNNQLSVHSGMVYLGTDSNRVSFDVYSTSATIYSNLNVKGNIYANNFSSDRKIKKNIKECDINAIEIIKKIKHKQFERKDDEKHYNTGYIAQEMEEIDSNFVLIDFDKDKKEKKYYINELPILATATKAIQELTTKVEELESKIKEMEGKNG